MQMLRVFGVVMFTVAGLFTGLANAAVTGECVNCHIMHNSQDGQAVASSGVGARWDATGTRIEGGASDAPLASLLVSDCVGCHSSAGTETVIALGDSNVPIVYNTGGTTTPLAGGNFYWVAGNDNYGHNVSGISGQDSAHTLEKGAPGSSLGSNNDRCKVCHNTLASDVGVNAASGCLGCHLPMHHSDDGSPGLVEGGDGWYRFLGSAMDAADGVVNPGSAQGVTGLEDSDWERTNGTDDHNVYTGTETNYANSMYPSNGSIGSFCSGCHGVFHSSMSDTSGAWIRHPSDVALPGAGTEYDDYEYTTLAPVAYEGADAVTSAPLVTCLSCHRAHGSSNPDMLRWNYENCVTGTEDTACGCFACHTTKDGVAGFVP